MSAILHLLSDIVNAVSLFALDTNYERWERDCTYDVTVYKVAVCLPILLRYLPLNP